MRRPKDDVSGRRCLCHNSIGAKAWSWRGRADARTRRDGDGREGGASAGDGTGLQLRPLEAATPTPGGVKKKKKGSEDHTPRGNYAWWKPRHRPQAMSERTMNLVRVGPPGAAIRPLQTPICHAEVLRILADAPPLVMREQTWLVWSETVGWGGRQRTRCAVGDAYWPDIA